jgi:hypothetical protein
VKSGKPKRSLPTTDGNGTPDGGSGI